MFSLEERSMSDFGRAVNLLFKTERKKYSIASAHLWLLPPIRISQIAYTTTRNGLWTGYATWAFLTPDTSALMANDPPYLYFSDWNEGLDLWIIDFVAPRSNAHQLARLLKQRLAPTHSRARRLVRNRRGEVIGVRSISLAPSRTQFND